MAAYPGAIVSFANVVDDDGAGAGTLLEASLCTTTNDELEAIEAELGVEPHGTCGSVAERMMFEFQLDGRFRNMLENWEGMAGAPFPGMCRKIQGDRFQYGGFSAALTFQEAFVQTPIVFIASELNNNKDGDAGCVVIKDPVTTTGFSFQAFTKTGAATVFQNKYNWIAITRDPPVAPPV